MIRNLTYLFGAAALLALGYLLGQRESLFQFRAPDRPTFEHNLVLEKVQELGRLELVRYEFQDIVKHEVVREWLPDPQVLLVAYGEAVGCIDLTRLDSSQLRPQGDSLLFINLPKPELCYSKLDHERSRVFNTQYTFWEEAELVDAAYRKAERAIVDASMRARVLERTESQAIIFLQPLLESISGRKVIIQFEQGELQPAESAPVEVPVRPSDKGTIVSPMD